MSGMINGVDTIYTIEYRRKAMHIESFKDRRAMVEEHLQITPVEEGPEDVILWLSSLHKKIEDSIANIRLHWDLPK